MSLQQTVIVPAGEVKEGGNSTPPYAHYPWWRQAIYYVAAGIHICRKDIAGLLTLVGLFEIPPLLAVIVGSQPGSNQPVTLAYWIATALPWITITLGNMAIVFAVEALDAGQPVIPSRILPATIRCFPRYIWANAITTLLFWGIFTPLQWLLGKGSDYWHWWSYAPLALLLLPMLFWHVRLVFATYAAIVDNHSGLRSVIISIGIPQRRWKMVAAAFAFSILIEAPVAGPLYFLIMRLSNPLVAEGFTWVLLMLMRPIFIATLHEIYEDYRPEITKKAA